MQKARIYKPAKTAMQSGKANTKQWLIEFERRGAKFHSPLNGWVGSDDTLQQVKLRFDTKEEAIIYAEKHGLDYELIQPKRPKTHIQAYADNFQ